MLMYDAPDVLRNTGIDVVEIPNWRTRFHYDSAGNILELPDQPYAVWHHDASPPGPTGWEWLIGNWDIGSAQYWVNTYGQWYINAPGVAWHAGIVFPNMPDNFNSFGVETDHTINEPWPDVQLESLRYGTAALLAHYGWGGAYGALWGHKEIAYPLGRKIDPDGLDMDKERYNVTQLITEGFDDMPLSDQDIQRIADAVWARTTPRHSVWTDGRVIAVDKRTALDALAGAESVSADTRREVGKITGAAK